jgi:hypothetical protein
MWEKTGLAPGGAFGVSHVMFGTRGEKRDFRSSLVLPSIKEYE